MEQRHIDMYYARYASHFDLLMRPFAHIRAEAIGRLRLSAGSRVLELGCGTGTSFPALIAVLQSNGRLIGVDRSPEMLGYAHEKIMRAGWTQVRRTSHWAAQH